MRLVGTYAQRVEERWGKRVERRGNGIESAWAEAYATLPLIGHGCLVTSVQWAWSPVTGACFLSRWRPSMLTGLQQLASPFFAHPHTSPRVPARRGHLHMGVPWCHTPHLFGVTPHISLVSHPTSLWCHTPHLFGVTPHLFGVPRGPCSMLSVFYALWSSCPVGSTRPSKARTQVCCRCSHSRP